MIITEGLQRQGLCSVYIVAMKSHHGNWLSFCLLLLRLGSISLALSSLPARFSLIHIRPTSQCPGDPCRAIATRIWLKMVRWPPSPCEKEWPWRLYLTLGIDLDTILHILYFQVVRKVSLRRLYEISSSIFHSFCLFINLSNPFFLA
ncbi:hypothetical protein BS47DRAFT_997196 [Hydnum rufescens UP504]|uniref:Uncharacterized protein n=1 Tax=Hydnum rufescens UP504 TaxID=1448309 RepID=A0A9P6B8P3_9AGAM|nr:hypothetical protein BS47DRAFT_997196 [Hydnum rufescens UP504]